MRAAFLGTPAAAVPALAALADVADVEIVVTRPDAPSGRRRRPASPPVKLAAAEWGFRIAQPTSDAELDEALRAHDLDVAVVVAYGRILKAETLALARFGFLNAHFSLLPRWRGASPVERAIQHGDPRTGVSLMVIDEGLDTGPVVSVIETPIADDETGGSLTARLSVLAATLLDETLPGYLAGRRIPAPQIDAATYAPMLHPADGHLDSSLSVVAAERMVRGFHPRPGTFLMADGKRLKVLKASPTDAESEPGTLTLGTGSPVVGLADGALRLDVVQPEGKRPLAGESWARGVREASLTVADRP